MNLIQSFLITFFLVGSRVFQILSRDFDGVSWVYHGFMKQLLISPLDEEKTEFPFEEDLSNLSRKKNQSTSSLENCGYKSLEELH